MGLLEGVLGGAGAGLFGKHQKYHDPYKAAAPWLEQQRNVLNPYVQQGQRVGGLYEGTAGQMAQNPQDFLNQLMASYQESPAFERQRDDALGAMHNSAAAGGMVGSPADQEYQGQLASSLASEDMQKWLNQVLGIQGRGMSAQSDIYGHGFQGAEDVANSYGNQAGLGYKSADMKNRRQQDQMNQLIKLLSTGAGAIGGGMAGGPAGAMQGAQIGNQFGSQFF